MMDRQQNQLDHMQINSTMPQTDNHASTALLNFTPCMLYMTSNNCLKVLKSIYMAKFY